LANRNKCATLIYAIDKPELMVNKKNRKNRELINAINDKTGKWLMDDN